MKYVLLAAFVAIMCFAPVFGKLTPTQAPQPSPVRFKLDISDSQGGIMAELYCQMADPTQGLYMCRLVPKN